MRSRSDTWQAPRVTCGQKAAENTPEENPESSPPDTLTVECLLGRKRAGAMLEKAAGARDAAAGRKSPGIGSAAPGAAAPPPDWKALSVTNLPEATSLLTETEKFFFDLRGWVLAAPSRTMLVLIERASISCAKICIASAGVERDVMVGV